MNQTKPENLFTIDCGDIFLREFRIEDANDIYNLSMQTEISDLLPDWKSTREQRLEWLTNYEVPANKEFIKAASGIPTIDDHQLKLGIILKETDEFIGWCCTVIKDELPAPNREINYAISRDHRNKGYTTKASKALVDYLFGKTNVEYLNAIALKHNQSSNKVIQKIGFHCVNNIEIENEEYHHYKINKKEWQKDGSVIA